MAERPQGTPKQGLDEHSGLWYIAVAGIRRGESPAQLPQHKGRARVPDPTHKLRLEYFRTESGREEVAEWINNRPPPQRAKLFWVLERLAESGFALGPPWLKKLDDDIWKYGFRPPGYACVCCSIQGMITCLFCYWLSQRRAGGRRRGRLTQPGRV